MPPNPGLAFAPLLGEDSDSLCEGVKLRAVRESDDVVDEASLPSREGVVVMAGLVTAGLEVDCRSGEGDAGDSGRRKGEALGEPPYEREGR